MTDSFSEKGRVALLISSESPSMTTERRAACLLAPNHTCYYVYGTVLYSQPVFAHHSSQGQAPPGSTTSRHSGGSPVSVDASSVWPGGTSTCCASRPHLCRHEQAAVQHLADPMTIGLSFIMPLQYSKPAGAPAPSLNTPRLRWFEACRHPLSLHQFQ